MAQMTLSALPAELIQCISEHLDARERIAFSAVSSSLRQTLVWTIFRHVKVHAVKTRIPRSEFIEKYGDYVCSVCLHVPLLPLSNHPAENEAREERNVQGTTSPTDTSLSYLSPTAAAILSGTGLPKCTDIGIKFSSKHGFGTTPNVTDVTWDDRSIDDSQGRGIWIWDQTENEEEVLRKESKFAWRATLAALWSALAENQLCLKLSLSNLPPKTSTAFSTGEWKTLIGRLTYLWLDFWGDFDVDGDGVSVHLLYGYQQALHDMRRDIFQHATRLKILAFRADVNNPIGTEDFGPSFLPFTEPCLTALQVLRLSRIVMHKDLFPWFSTGGSSLRTIHLQDCSINTYNGIEEYMWAGLFQTIRESCKDLSSLTYAQHERSPLTYNEWAQKRDEESDDQQIARRLLSAHPYDFVFAYSRMDEMYGAFVPAWETNLDRMMDGEDRRQYELLQEELRCQKDELLEN